jgi:hypothetical protein
LTFAATFWETFFLFLIFLPLALIWGFALLDIFRRDDMADLHDRGKLTDEEFAAEKARLRGSS